MRYAAKRKQDVNISKAPIELVIPLEKPVTIYTAKELAVMPLSAMNAAIEAQEKFAVLEHTTQMGGASYSGSSSYGGWSQTYPGERKIPYSLQDQQRVYSAKNYSTACLPWISKVGGS
ncbi:hypothetical protein F903_01519 [Acinetobacter sp. NIPH 298]|nr:hypothetical protein F903_01519 [Acinetobacter sp. NIPH 298]